MVAIGDQRRAVDLPSDADAKHRHGLVAQKADHAGGGKPAELYDLAGVDDAVDGLIACHQRARQNDQHDDEAGEVLDPAVTVGEGFSRLPPSEREGDPERNCRPGISNVVDRVREQRHAVRDKHDDEL
jgi:hypothetical protein